MKRKSKLDIFLNIMAVICGIAVTGILIYSCQGAKEADAAIARADEYIERYTSRQIELVTVQTTTASEPETETETETETEIITELETESEYIEISEDYDILAYDGALNEWIGVVYFTDPNTGIEHRETYYSQQVLDGAGLDIPDRWVDEYGLVRDGDGYICVATDWSFIPYGAIVETSLGTGKVYDTGCSYGTVDIYTDW